ncbi:MAG: histidinol-phosphatase HisJ family protein [Solirubrobacterales bacterium]
MALIDYHIHALAHGEYQLTAEWLTEYLASAKQQGIIELGISDHDEFQGTFDPAMILDGNRISGGNPVVRLGLEVDYKPSRETELAHLIRKAPYDYVIGSVHHIGEWLFDHPDYRSGYDTRSVDAVYAEYYTLVERMCRSGLFDVVGHIDLVKIWGHRPAGNSGAAFAGSALKAIRECGMVVEINSAGLRKPVGELYPEDAIIRRLFESNIPITLGSDAHRPDDVGLGLGEAAAAARRAGYRKVTGFQQHQQLLFSLD